MATVTVSGAPDLSNSPINIAALREHSRKELIEILDMIQGKKAVVLDPGLTGPLGLVAEGSLLKEHGVEKIFHLSGEPLPTESKNLIYIVRPRVQNMKFIAEHIRQHENEGQKKGYYVYFVPRRTMICERALESEGVYGSIVIGEYPLDLIPFEEDVLSLELDTSYRECLLDGDKTSLYYVARSLMKIQTLFGIIPHVKGKGTCSKLVYDMLVRMRKEMSSEQLSVMPEIDNLILIDRDVDMVTPCCTQLTYEGLIDETFGIQNGLIEIDPELVGAQPGKKVKIPLNSNDKVYHSFRNMNFSALKVHLKKKAKDIEEYYNSRHGAQTVTQIRDFAKKLSSTQQEHKSLSMHTKLFSKISDFTTEPEFRKRLEAEQALLAGTDLDASADYIEECINKKDPLVKIIRLLVLYSTTCGGIKVKQLEHFKREILQTYGFEFLFTLNNLEKLGLIRKQEGKSIFSALRKPLRLIVEEVDEGNPADIAYVYSGYAPLACRIIQQAARPGGWRSIDELLRMLPGPTFEETQPLPPSVGAGMGGSNSTGPVNLVVFIGGVTFTEIAALRFISQQEQVNFIIATTKLINGDSILNSIVELI